MIIDDPIDLMELSGEELHEVLLDDKYNKALLRELVRRSLSVAEEYRNAWDYDKKRIEDLEKEVERLEDEIYE